jgi:hypothetical protein
VVVLTIHHGARPLSYDARNADLLFPIIRRRDEHKGIVMTANLAFSDWPTSRRYPDSGRCRFLRFLAFTNIQLIAERGDREQRSGQHAGWLAQQRNEDQASVPDHCLSAGGEEARIDLTLELVKNQNDY